MYVVSTLNRNGKPSVKMFHSFKHYYKLNTIEEARVRLADARATQLNPASVWVILDMKMRIIER
jgi:hypothetical protein